MTASPAAMPGARPIPAAPSGLAALDEIADPEHPWTAARDAAEVLAATLLPPRPTPAAMPTTTPRSGPLYGLQFLRKEAVRLAIDSYRDTDRPTDDQLLATAERLAGFIRAGEI